SLTCCCLTLSRACGVKRALKLAARPGRPRGKAPLAPGCRRKSVMTSQALLDHLLFAAGLAALSALLVRLMIAFPILDHPDHRKAHTRPTPKGGGIGIVGAFVAGMLALFLTA